MSVYDAKSIPAEVNSSTKDPQVRCLSENRAGSCALSCHASSRHHPMCCRPAWLASSRAWPKTGAGLMAAPDRSSSSTRAWDEKLDGETK